MLTYHPLTLQKTFIHMNMLIQPASQYILWVSHNQVLFQINSIGSVALTSIDYGFFMLGPNWDAIGAEVAAKKAYSEKERWRSILHYDEGATCPKLRQTVFCDVVQCD